MFLIPVLDLLGGRAVRAVAGRRSSYRPLEPQCDPQTLAGQFVRHWQFAHLYVADLDAIQHGERRWKLYARLHQAGARLWLDLGLRSLAELKQAACCLGGLSPPPRLILALETLADPDLLRRAGDWWPRERLAFSLDLCNGRPLGNAAWPSDPAAVAELVHRAGLRQMILLDLADVGRGRGVSTLSLWQSMHRRWPDLRGVLGGGVASVEQLRQLEQAGVWAVLVASMLHRRTITPEQIARCGWNG